MAPFGGIVKPTKLFIMPLKYALFENHLTPEPDDYMAVVQNYEAKTQDDVINLMISRGSTVTRAEALSVMEEYGLATEQLLKDGYGINTPLFNLSPSIQGIFNGSDDSFDRSRHTVKINISPGTRIKGIAGTISVEKVKGASPKPDPEYLEDKGSGTRNDTLTPGNIAMLKGSRLKFDEADPLQGIFFVALNGTATKVATVSRNKPSELHFLIPTLSAGEYSVEVRVMFKNTKDLKVGWLNSNVTVK